jgi:hypothetical protein
VAGINDPGYGNNAEHEPVGEMDNPQPSPKARIMAMDAVHRLNGSGSARRGLKI